MKSEPQKVVIIESNLAYRDYLRNLVSGKGDLSFCFQSEIACLDNLDVLDPDWLIAGTLGAGRIGDGRNDADRVFRLLNALQLIDHTLPVLLITDSLAVQDYAALNRFEHVVIVNDYEKITALETHAAAGRHNRWKSESKTRPPLIIGNSPQMIQIKKALSEVGQSSESVLIRGEKGAGKEILARAIHFNSAGRAGLFVKVDASALSAEDPEWRLVDFLKDGPLNGKAKAATHGQAVAGTLYFDEICNLSCELQAELLLILERDGGSLSGPAFTRAPEYRIIAGTHKNIDRRVAQNHFRKDLYYRMNVFNLNLPPLRDRRADIPLLTDYFTFKYCRDFKKSYFELSNNVKQTFLNYGWPGNVHELEKAVRQAVVMRSEKNFLSHFRATHKGAAGNQRIPLPDMQFIDTLLDPGNYLKKIDNMSLKAICWDCLADIEKNIMKKALDTTNWNRRKAADMLDISYTSMLNKIKEYGLAS